MSHTREDDRTSESSLRRQAHVLDELGGFTEPEHILVRDGIVESVGANLTAPGELPTYDFSDLSIMPGVFDCHIHITASATSKLEVMRRPWTRLILETAQNLRPPLERGVTFIRDAAGADAGLRDAVEQEFITGPTLQVCINILSQSGGHGDRFLERSRH